MTELTNEQRAAQIASKLVAPLSADECHVCKLMGLSEQEFLEQRNSQLRAQLPSWHAGMEHGLTKEETEVAALLNIPPADYSAQKVADAAARQKRLGG